MGGEEKQRGRWRDHSVKRKRTNEETETPGEEGLREWAVSPNFLKGQDRAWVTVLSCCYREQRVPGRTLHSLLSQTVGGNSLRCPDRCLVVGTQQSPVTGREKTVMPGDAAGPEKRAGEALRAQRCL